MQVIGALPIRIGHNLHSQGHFEPREGRASHTIASRGATPWPHAEVAHTSRRIAVRFDARENIVEINFFIFIGSSTAIDRNYEA